MDVLATNQKISVAVAHGSWERVLELTQAVLDVDPRSLKAMEARALAFATLDRHAEALAAYDAVVQMFEERANRGLEVATLLAAAIVRRAHVAARMGDAERALADVARARRVDPTTDKRLQADPAWKELLKAPALDAAVREVRRQGILIEISSPPGPGRRASSGRSDLFVLGSAAEVIEVLRVEIRHLTEEFIVDSTGPTMTASTVSRGVVSEPIDLRSFIQVEWTGGWRSLQEAKAHAFGETPIFRIVEDQVRATFPAKKSHLKDGEVLHLTKPYVARGGHETESAHLDHGAYELESGEHFPLSVALRQPG